MRPTMTRAITLAALALVAGACVTVDPRAAAEADGSPPTSATPSLAADETVAPADPPASVPPADPSASVPPGERSAAPSLGFIGLDDSLPFSQAVSQGVREAASAAGLDLVECDVAWSRERVETCAQELAAAGVHAVISFQPFADLAEDVCAATGAAPTVAIVFDQGSCQVSQLQIDQAGSGRLAGAAMGAFVQERFDCEVNAYVSLESSDADPDGRARMQGYRDGFSQHCPLPERQLTIDGADRLATAEAQVADLLGRLEGSPNVVVGLNESAILGAMQAARRAGREADLWYSGQLADPTIRRDIACDEHYVASVAQFPERFGGPLVATAVAAIAGGEIAPLLEAELQLVTAANVRTLFPDTPACDG